MTTPLHARSTARIAVYDDMLSSPRIIDVPPGNAREYINEIASKAYSLAKEAGGSIPYSVILQVAENFIHSGFTEVVVTILDDGKTIRFSDQGPGIADKEKARTPGYSSATAEMKQVIDGVGSGLPIVSEYMQTMHGRLDIDDNMDSGAVVTISLEEGDDPADHRMTVNGMGTYGMDGATDHPSWSDRMDPGTEGSPHPNTSMRSSSPRSSDGAVPHPSFTPSADQVMRAMVSERGMRILDLFDMQDVWGVSEISEHLDIPPSSVFNELKKLEEAGMITKLGKKRILTDMGAQLLHA